MYVDDHEQFMFTGLEEEVLDVTEKDIWAAMSFVGSAWMMQGVSYRFSANPLVTGIVDRSDESRPPQATVSRPELDEQTLQEA